MKKCNACGAQAEEQANFCPACGSADLIIEEAAEQDGELRIEQIENVAPAENINDHGNIIAGIVGAFLLSIVGGLLYFIIYQAGVIAGISGLAMYVLANFGYGLFAGTKNTMSIVRLVTTIAVTAVMIFLSEYVCISYEIYQVFKEYEITFFDAVRATPEFLADPEISGAVAKDLLFAYAFAVAATIGNISSTLKARKNK